jgi:hypothetical protein
LVQSNLMNYNQLDQMKYQILKELVQRVKIVVYSFDNLYQCMQEQQRMNMGLYNLMVEELLWNYHMW